MLNSVVGGSVITQVRDSIYLVDVIGRAKDVERSSIETYPNLQVPGRNNQSIPLPAFASIGYGLEQPPGVAALAPADHHGQGHPG
jgi:multidrug efflux pump